MIERGTPEILLQAKVMVDQVVADTELPGQLAHRHGAKAGFRKGHERGVQYLAPCAFGRGAARAPRWPGRPLTGGFA